MLTALLALAVAACGNNDDGEDPTGPHNRFQARVDLAEGMQYTLSGDGAGHQAGERSSFTLVLDNHAGQPWQGELCVLLVDAGGVQQVLLATGFEVSADAQQQFAIEEEWRSDLDPGAYGLAAVFPGRSSQVVTIWFGAETDEPSLSSPAIRSCPD